MRYRVSVTIKPHRFLLKVRYQELFDTILNLSEILHQQCNVLSMFVNLSLHQYN